MPKLTNLAGSAPRPVKVEWEGPVVEVIYRRDRLTGAVADRAMMAPEPEQVRRTAETLAELLEGWDITDDDEQPLPITVENLLALPVALLTATMLALGQDSRPDPTSAGSFGNG